MNLIQFTDCWRAVFWGFLENLFEYYFLNVIVNVNFFSDLKFEYYGDYYPEKLS